MFYYFIYSSYYILSICRRMLWNKSDNTSDPAMSNYADIYLCDTCDKDFDSLRKLIVSAWASWRFHFSFQA